MSYHGEGIINRLHPDTPLRKETNDGHKFIHGTIGEYLDRWMSKHNFHQYFLLTATGKYLDLHGIEYGVFRNEDESDDDYRKRILLEKRLHNCIPDLKRQGVMFWDYVSGLRAGSQNFYFQFFDYENNYVKNEEFRMTVEDMVTGESDEYLAKTDKQGLVIFNINVPENAYSIHLVSTGETYDTFELAFSMHSEYTSKQNTMILSDIHNINRYNQLGFKLYGENGVILPNKTITITIHGVTYTRTTNEDGIAFLNIRLDGVPDGEFGVVYEFEGDDEFNSVGGSTVIRVIAPDGGTSENVQQGADYSHSLFFDAGFVYDSTSTELTSKNTLLQNTYLAHASVPVQKHMQEKFILEGVLEWI